jgi:TonB-linked SusC/RagA family outer membrane protein
MNLIQKNHSMFKRIILIALLFNILNAVYAQSNSTKNLSGVVADVNGEPLIGVNIIVEGSKLGTITDVNGRFSIRINSEDDKILFSYIGYTPTNIVVGKQKNVKIIMEQISEMIDEIVVVGYGSQRKETVTGAITSISSEKLLQSPVANVSNALAGKLPGLMAVQSNGEPGRNQATLKIRGIGTLNAGKESNPLILVDGIEREILDDIDPNEIETLNILKDASATAVFGVRGANGVIIVNTKTGKEGKPKVSYTSNFGVQNPINLPDILNSYEYALLKNEGLSNDGAPPIFTEQDLQFFKDGTSPLFYPSKNWMQEFIKSAAFQQQHNVNISGGGSLMKYFVSFGFTEQEGLYDSGVLDVGFRSNPNYKRYNVRTNFDFNLSKNLTTSVRFGTSITNTDYPNVSTDDLFYRFYSYQPFSSPGIVNGKIISGFINDPMGTYAIEKRGESPYSYLLSRGYQDTFGNKISLNWNFDYKMDFITKGLGAKLMIAYDDSYFHSSNWNKTVDLYGLALTDPVKMTEAYIQTSFDGNFSFSESFSKWRKFYIEGALNYVKDIKDHNVTGLLLFNASKEHDPDFSYKVPKSMLGVVGRMTYNYSNKYFFEFNMGYNGSEQFPEGKRFGFFPAFSGGWTISEESFIPQNNLLTFAKLRASYGEVGNDKTGGDRFLYLPDVYTYLNGANNGYWFGTRGENLQKYTGSAEGQIGNPNVTWERARKANIGIDIRLFKSKLSLTADYFSENRDNILWYRGTIPAFVAATLPKVNLGKVANKGVEFDVSWRNSIQDFSYWLNGNFSFARNKILYRDEAPMPYDWMNQTGFSVGQYKGYVTNGFYNTQEEVDNRPYYAFSGTPVQRGDLKFVDINGDGIINEQDIVPIGFSSALPEIGYGVSFGATYKSFDFSVLFQGVGNSSLLLREMSGWAFDQQWRSTLAVFKERWSVERYEAGETITQPRLSSNGATSINAVTSDFLLKNSDYLRLKNVEIGYKLPKALLKKIGITSGRIYVNGNNLLTFTSLKNVDPESKSTSGSYYPLTRVFNIGVNLQF